MQPSSSFAMLSYAAYQVPTLFLGLCGLSGDGHRYSSHWCQE